MVTVRLHREGQEDFGMHLRKLWETESGHRESRLPFLYSFRTPPPNFLGALSHGEPQARAAFALESRDVLPPTTWTLARFRSLDRRVTHYTRPVLVGHAVCGEMGG